MGKTADSPQMTQNLSLVKQDSKGVVEMSKALTGHKDVKFVFYEEKRVDGKIEISKSEPQDLKATLAEINRRILHMALAKRGMRSYPIDGVETLIEKGTQLSLGIDGVPGRYTFTCPSAKESGKMYNMTPTDQIRKVQDKFQAFLHEIMLLATDKKQREILASLQTVK